MDFWKIKYPINNPTGMMPRDGDLVIIHFRHTDRYAYLFKKFSNNFFIRILNPASIEDSRDVRLESIIFKLLEPVSWWKDEHRTIESPIFKALAALLDIQYNHCSGMPGYFDNITNSPLPKGWVV
jgi:hypothetical protein